MKKIMVFVALVAGIFMFNSCNKEQLPNEYAEVSFDYFLMGDGEYMTKGNNEVFEILNSFLPKYFPLELESQKTRVKYYFNTGEERMLPIGEYKIKIYYGTDCTNWKIWDGEKWKKISYGGDLQSEWKVRRYPQYKLSENIITITKDENIKVKIEYDVAAIFYDNTVIEAVGDYFMPNTYSAPLSADKYYLNVATKFNDLSVFFVRNFTGTITLYPYSNLSYEPTKYKVSSAEIGKYYILSCKETDTNSLPIEGFISPEITEGTMEESSI